MAVILHAAAVFAAAGGASAQAPGGVPAPAAAPGAELRVWLVSIGPGPAVWERFGHNAIRVLDTRTGRDVAYNWGIFDFNQVDFIPRFLKGQMLYSMAAYDSQAMITAYGQTGRDVVLQELALTPEQKLTLQDFAETNARPENRDYFYDYFRDNCSTRVRDVLDLALGGALAARFRAQGTGTSYRFHIRRLTEVDPFLFTGMDVLLGTPGDRPISVWEEMFLPMTLRDHLRDVSVRGPDGRARPLVMSEEVVVPSAFLPEAQAPPEWLGWYVLVGLLLGGAVAAAGALVARSLGTGARGLGARFALAALAGAWSLLAGAVGVILVAVLFTDHVFMAGNENLFLFTPVSFVVGVGVVVSAVRGSTPAWALRGAGLAALLAVLGLIVGFLPLGHQRNTIFEAMAIPAHLGVLAALVFLRQRPPV